ncbi:MAG: mechanosensitive ion channel family protein [Bacteroidetes bacterium]|nr:MAG: mechanosensitive ion channel family protein [Bacteroidota bacterium]
MGMAWGLKLLGAIVVLLIGLWIIKAITNKVKKTMEKKDTDASLRSFLLSILGLTLKILLFISVLSMLGIEMTSFIAILAMAGLAIGMALSGTLQNFAGGVMILIFKPFKVGDFIDAQGYMGTVKEIQIFITILKTPDNKTVIIPNGGLSTGALTNFSTEPTRRVDWSFGIAYGDDYDVAKSMVLKLIKADKRIMTNPEPFIALGEMADSSVNITVRVWVNAADYWGVHFDMNELFYKNTDKHGLSIPFPQMDVHLDKV